MSSAHTCTKKIGLGDSSSDKHMSMHLCITMHLWLVTNSSNRATATRLLTSLSMAQTFNSLGTKTSTRSGLLGVKPAVGLAVSSLLPSKEARERLLNAEPKLSP